MGGLAYAHAPRTAAHLAAVLDTRQVRIERQGVAGCHPARVGLVALDEGIDADERLADALRDRLALSLDFSHQRAVADDGPVHGWTREHIAEARALLPDGLCPPANPLRIHSKLNYLSPVQFAQKRLKGQVGRPGNRGKPIDFIRVQVHW